MQRRLAAVAGAALLWSIVPNTLLRAEEKLEKAGAAAGLTVGNVLFVPIKAVSAAMGAITGALSFVLMGGDDEVTKQVWRDTLSGPYVITPELAKKAIGERPELKIDE
jgi:hypothetical protein